MDMDMDSTLNQGSGERGPAMKIGSKQYQN